MKVSVLGFEGAGSTTLYRAAARGQAKGDVTAVPVPDPRFDAIVEQVKPKKVTPATVIFQDDLDPLNGSGKMMSQKTIDGLRKTEAILHVVRCFESPMAPYYAEVDGPRDEVRFYEELLISDLQMVETRLEKLAKSQNARSAGHPEYNEKQMMERLLPVLESMKPLRQCEFTEDEMTFVKNYQFLTAKPMVVAFNVNESEASNPSEHIQKAIAKLAEQGTPAFTVCATIEDEVAQLDPADQPEFLADLGLTEPASNRMIQALYDAMGLITFFTAGENETRAWTVRRGSNAVKAAGTIHTDIAKGFIRAEVVSYADYQAAGSLDAAYSAGKMRLEGKEYIVHDGDLLHIRNKS